ncbi:Polar-differentiation response regulator DivK [Stieleria neptunia]|uniref:Polar-differentiation response regulator DivK n=1 Tax=Stieleria neptunia TaxID=2527979 RepID=A0A518HTL6_9BACT|nr:response regulator [Stieleria neptunia]QDV44143.1 Polar-differentiation response regulator DivK [Stieleria neptunia]
MSEKQILIADDDQDLLELLSLRCKQLGLDVITVSDAMDALANADYYAPQIALLDVRMPGGNGVSVSEMMATDERLSQTSVIVMTGDPNEKIQQRCHEMGAQLVKKDQQIWTRLEPLLKALLEDGAEHQATPLAEFSDVQSTPADEGDESLLSMLKDWGWLDDSQPSAVEEEAATDAAPWVLAIDDDPDFSIGLQKRLLSVGVQLVRAYRGMDGYRSAFQSRPAAILLDYQMPDGNGEYILRRLKESAATDSVPVIVVTGMRDASLKRRMLAGGASEFLSKPVSWDQLKRALVQYTDLDLRTSIVPEAMVCSAV